MGGNLQKWQRSLIRNALGEYRQSLENYYIGNKRLVEVSNGLKAFSLLSPPMGSNAARRRIRCIAENIVDRKTVVSDDGTAFWGSRTPHFITVAVTYRCQCNCAHCSAHTYRQRTLQRGDGLTPAEIKDAIRETVNDLGTTCVILTGGEPLLEEFTFDLVASVDPARSVCTVFTNGEYLTDETVRRLKKSGLFGVFLSLDFTSPDKHDQNRKRPGLYQKAVEGLKRCQDAGILTGISTYITHEKLSNGELDSMMDLARELDVLEVFLFDVIATGRLDRQRGSMLKDEEVEQVKAFRQRYNEKPDYPRIIHQTMFTSIAYPCAAEGCPAGVAQIHLRANGDVAPCDFTPFSFGNIRQRSLSDIWRDMVESPVFSQGSPRCRLADPAYLPSLNELAADSAEAY